MALWEKNHKLRKKMVTNAKSFVNIPLQELKTLPFKQYFDNFHVGIIN